MSGGKLPEGWVKTTIGVICEVKGGKRLPKGKALLNTATEHPYIRVTDFENGSVNLSTIKYLDSDTYSAISNYTISKNDLYISIAGTIGLIGEIPEQLDNANLTENAAKLCSILGTDKKYLKYVLSSNKTIEQFDDKTTSSGQPKLALFRIRDCEFPYASINEQKIIAKKIDTLLAQVDSTKAHLEQIPQILKRFRQAVLNSSIALNAQESKIKLAELTSKIGSGSTPKGGNNNYKSDGIPFVRSLNIHTHFIKYEDLAYIDNEQANKLNNVVIREKDVLLNITGASIGRVNIAPDIFVGGRVNQHVAIIRCQQSKILPEYLHVYMASPKVQKWIQGENYGATRQALTKKMLEELLIIVPPLPEQHEIVRRVEQLFAYADTIEKQVNSALTRVNNLTQSILAKAFRGELTAQWRAENPDLISGENSAAALLEKIKAERAACGGKKTSRKKS